jgi:hypothetical protein
MIMTTANASAPKEVAALLVIGDKILSGRTKDKNIGYIAEYLTALGIDLKEVRARVIPRRQNDRHPVMDVGHKRVGIGRDDGKCPNPLARGWFSPVLPDAGDAERRAVLYRNRVGLFRPLALDRLPFEEAIPGTMQRRMR